MPSPLGVAVDDAGRTAYVGAAEPPCPRRADLHDGPIAGIPTGHRPREVALCPEVLCVPDDGAKTRWSFTPAADCDVPFADRPAQGGSHEIRTPGERLPCGKLLVSEGRASDLGMANAEPYQLAVSACQRILAHFLNRRVVEYDERAVSGSWLLRCGVHGQWPHATSGSARSDSPARDFDPR